MESKNKKPFTPYENYVPHLQPVDRPKGSRISRLKAWLKRHKKPVLAGCAVLLLLCSGVVYFVRQHKPEPAKANTATPVRQQPAPKIYSPLTGLEVSEADSKRLVTAIMIENSPDARPQSGLKDGGVIFEAIAEGGITRFLVLYQEAQPTLIGPVRSLRPYYIDWLAAFDPAVAHVGGSVNALREIRSGSYKDIDQFLNGGSYWRAKDRYAPHNVYTSFERLNELNAKKGFTSSNFTGFTRKEDTKASAPNATIINVPISSGLFNSSYTYDPATNSYLRSQAGKPHLDREKGQLNPRVVIVLEAAMSLVMEDGYRESIQTIGSGKATIFQDGVVTAATWHKPSKQAQVTFTDPAGKAIALNRGQTWLTVVQTGKTPTWQ